MWGIREEEFALHFKALPAGQRIKLTSNRLTRKKSNLVSYMQGIHRHTHTNNSKDSQHKAYMRQPKLRRGARAWRYKEEKGPLLLAGR